MKNNYYSLTKKELLKQWADNLTHPVLEDLIDELLLNGEIDYLLVDGEKLFPANTFRNALMSSPQIYQYVSDIEIRNRYRRIVAASDREIMQHRQNSTLKRRIRLKTTITIPLTETNKTADVRVCIPYPAADLQLSNPQLISCSHINYRIADNSLQTVVLIEANLEESNQFAIVFEYQITTMSRRGNNQETGADLSAYLEEEGSQIVFSDRLKKLVKEVIGSEKEELKKARLIYNYITGTIRYSLVQPYYLFTDICEYALDNKKGDCGLQALLFIVMCRIAGIPATWQSGYYVNPHFVGYHDWARFYIEPQGWLYADLAYGNLSLIHGKTENWEYYFGNLDGFRCVTANGFEKEFAAIKRYQRYDAYDNQAGEVEYDWRALTADEYQTNIELLEMEEIL